MGAIGAGEGAVAVRCVTGGHPVGLIRANCNRATKSILLERQPPQITHAL